MANFRDARRDEVPAIVALLADDVLGAGRETAARRETAAGAGYADEVYWAAFDDMQLTTDKRRPGAIRFCQSLGFTATHEGFKLPL